MTSSARFSARIVAAAIASVLALGACGESSSQRPTGGEHLVVAAAPDGWTAHDQGAIELSTPASWTPFTPDAAEGAASTGSTSYGVRAPSAADGSGSGAFTVLSSKPKEDAAHASTTARRIALTTLGALDPVEEELSWPRAKAAAYLTYHAKLPMPSGPDVTFRYEVLVLDLAGGSQAVVTVVGPVSGYDGSDLHAVLATTTIA